MRVSLLLVVLLATILLVQDCTCWGNPFIAWRRFAREHLQSSENGYNGCWRDGVSNRLLSHRIGRGIRNIPECAVRCLGYTYFGMEDRDECFCGNQLHRSSSRNRVNDYDCDRICLHMAFNDRWICGAPGRITVFRTENYYTYMERFPDDPLTKVLNAKRYLQTIENGYLGCWRDRSSNRLLGHRIGREVRNIQDCAVRCLGYTFFGMEDYDECFCGNEFPTSSPESENNCNRLCSHPDYNNANWICGSAGRISLYNAEDHYTYMERFPDDPLWKIVYARQHLQTIENGYLGCWRDRSSNRLLSHVIGRGVQNVPDCAVRCLGYTYFGMEDYDECFCGNEFPTSSPVSESNCNILCSHPDYNNANWICGSAGRISLYNTEDHYTYMERFPDDPLWKIVYARKHLETIENGYYGCWRDLSSNRVLSHKIGREVRNIPDCATRCLGYTFFGMKNYDECFCGNQFPTSSPVSDNYCDRLCSHPDYNNANWICGSAGRISLYNTEDHYTYMERFPDDPLWKIVYARKHIQTVENGYLGCWRDRSSNRLLRHRIGRGVQNIPDCAVRCLGYTFFGMEDYDECFCDNWFPTSSPVSDNYCDRLCSRPDYNNTNWICGSAGRISLYNTEDHYTYMERFPDYPLWKILYARQHLQTIENGYYGCWMGGRSNRLLRHEIGRGVQNLQDCAVLCLGFTFFGMEDRDHGFCGNQPDFSRSRERVSDNECDTLCRHQGYNNTDWICGAPQRITLYRTEAHLAYMEQFTNDSLVQSHLDHYQMHDH